MASVLRIKGDGGVIIESNTFLELPKALQQTTTGVEREGMIRYNSAWAAFEGVIRFEDSSIAYRRFAMLDSNGRLLTSQLPDSITSGLQYVGTYSPLSDDIDPPLTSGVYTWLPAPTTDNKGEYYIVRGIMDAAQTHFTANNPTTATVIFSPTNPSGQGNWLQIKYFTGDNPNVPGTKMVIAAFARLITASIPSTHVGLTSLALDPDLTAAFGSGTNPADEKALTDSDWVIMADTKVQRIRNSRASILASSVLYDSTISNSSGRKLTGAGGTIQSVADTLILYGLRRTGDSMLNDGSIGGGRLGLINGTAAAPSIGFNNAVYDPVNNPGVDPSKWTDPDTGIFHPTDGAIGLTANGTERLRVSPTQLILYPTTGSVAAPNILFSASGNTNLGMNVTGNTINFVSNGATNVILAQGLSTFNGNISVTGNSTVQGNSTVNGNTILGDAATDTLTVNAASTFVGSTLFNNNVNRFALGAVFSSGATLSFEGTNTATITKAATELRFNMANFNDVSIYDGTTLRTKFNRYGVQLPVLNPIDNAVGVDGMIAYSTQRNTVMQKSNGQWTTVSGGGVETNFTTASWVLNGSYYTFTVTNANMQQVAVQELVGSNYSPVEVDSIVISSTNAVISVPATPDLRFNGRVIVTYR